MPQRWAVCLFVMLWAPTCVVAAPRISFELITEPGFPMAGAQRWIDVLKDVDPAGLRIRAGRAGERAEVVNRGTDAAPSYHVIGILTANNRLSLPGGGEFTLSDRARITQWIEKLADGGIAGLTATRVAFGLTSEQLLDFDERLSKSIAFPTKGLRAGDVSRQIVQGIQLESHVSPEARQAFSRNETVLDELTGLSAGTALAATLRPLGLVLSPEKPRNGDVRLLISDVREVKESWPVGWPPQVSPKQAAPKLYEYLTVEIQETSLAEAILAIQGRVDVPFLFDHNGMARQNIDTTTVKVSYPRKRVQYLRVLNQVLFQGQLVSEVRVDEADRPFLWISPRRS